MAPPRSVEARRTAGVQAAALSVGRGNGKSALVAAIASAVVDPEGPLHGPRREVVCVASSFEQARVIYEDVLAFLGARYDLDDRPPLAEGRTPRIGRSSRGMAQNGGCRVRCIGSDPSTAHGLRPFLAFWLDEPSAVRHGEVGPDARGDPDGAREGSGLPAGGARDPARDGRPLVRPDAGGRRGLFAGSRVPSGRPPVPAADLAAGEPEH